MVALRTRKKFFGVRYHGNYCGPGWSNRTMEGSVPYGSVRPVDEFDRTCRSHDSKYALGSDLNRADEAFYYANYGKGVKRTLAALAVMAQRRSRGNKQTSTEIMLRPEQIVSSKKMFTPPRSASKRKYSVAMGTGSSRASSSRSVAVQASGPPVLVLQTKRSRLGYSKRSRPGYTKKKRSKGKGKRKTSVKRRKQKKKLSKYAYCRNGTLLEREIGGSIETVETSFLGHNNMPQLQVLDAVCRTIILACFAKVGIFISDLKAAILNNPSVGLNYWRLRIIVQPTDVDSNTNIDTLIDGTSSDNLVDSAKRMSTAIRAVIADRPCTFIKIQLFYDADYEIQPGQLRAEFNAQDFMLDLYGRSVMRLQNRTGGNPIDGTLANTTIDISRNPLKYRLFDFNGNYVIPRSRGETNPNMSFLGTNENGLITNGTNTYESMNKLLPKSYFTGVSKTTDGKLDPGQIMTSIIESHKKVSLRQFFLKYFYEMNNSDVTTKSKLGKSKMYQWEKLLDIRINAEEALIKVGYQLDTVIGCKYSYKPKHITTPVIELGPRT